MAAEQQRMATTTTERCGKIKLLLAREHGKRTWAAGVRDDRTDGSAEDVVVAGNEVAEGADVADVVVAGEAVTRAAELVLGGVIRAVEPVLGGTTTVGDRDGNNQTWDRQARTLISYKPEGELEVAVDAGGKGKTGRWAEKPEPSEVPGS